MEVLDLSRTNKNKNLFYKKWVDIYGLEKEKKENIKIGISEISKTFEHFGIETKKEKGGVKVEIIRKRFE